MFLFTLYRLYSLYKLAAFYLAPLGLYARLAMRKVLPEKQQPRLQLQRGQGLVEYALVLVLVAVVVIAILTLLGPQVGFAFFKVNCSLAGGTVVQYQQTEFYDCLIDPNGSNAPPNRMLNFNLETGAAEDFRN